MSSTVKRKENEDKDEAKLSDISLGRCTKCQNLCLSDITAEGYMLYSDVASLLGNMTANGATSCDLCSLILSSLRSDMHKLQSMSSCSVTLYRYPPGHQLLEMVYVVVTEEKRRSDFMWCPEGDGRWYLGPPDEKPWLVRGYITVYADLDPDLFSSSACTVKWRRAESYSGSNRCFDLISNWLSDCLTNHHGTCPINENSPLPRRVVDVGPPDGSRQPLLVTTTEGQTGKYITLSYCWGKRPFFTLRSSNMEKFKQSIPLINLPQTVHDAITLARRLDVRYIWVDSLCIIQGQDYKAIKDWEREGKSMDKVFQGAFFTVKAAGASDAYKGLFNHRTPPRGPYCTFPIDRDQSRLVYLGQNANITLPITEPLDQRGWAFQEALLSLRCVSFGSEELSWKCQCCSRRECASDSIEVQKSSIKREEPAQLRYNWNDIVEEYSLKSFTYVSDKLPAIAGLARLGSTPQDEYYFGAFKNRIIPSLLWRHLGRIENGKYEHVKQDNMRRRAPSWSWASVDGKVKFLTGYMDDSIDVKEFRMDGSIYLEGIIKKVDTMRLQISASYYGGYDNYLPWAKIPRGAKTYLDSLAAIPHSHLKSTPGITPELLDVRFLYLGTHCGLILIKETNTSPIKMRNDTKTLRTRKGKTLALASTTTARILGERLRQICDSYGADNDKIDKQREEENEEEKNGEFGFHLHRHSFLRIGAFEGIAQGRDCRRAKLLLR
ncbi:hypothetical protein Trisim1_012424 [Trichoderma cf. simile WF8]